MTTAVPPTTAANTPVAIVGAGPVGLSLALGLARCGVRSTLVERDETMSRHSKAPVLHQRTREVLRQWGVEDRFVEHGRLLPDMRMHDARSGRTLLHMDLSALASEADRPGLLLLEQSETERLLLQAVEETGMCTLRFGADAVGLSRGDGFATVSVREATGRYDLRADYVVGADGASSFVRKALGLPFEGRTFPFQPVLADVATTEDRPDLPWPRMLNEADALSTCFRLRPHRWRIIRLEGERVAKRNEGDEATNESIARTAARLLDVDRVDVVWASRFRVHRRHSPRMRVGRVLLAGDAAHIHPPAGGQGMNAGIQDAHNLAWKLAACLRGGHAEILLDSYERERKAVVVESVSTFTSALARLFVQAPAPSRSAAFALAKLAMKAPFLRARFLRRFTMLDLHYPPNALSGTRARAPVGQRLPNVELRRASGARVRLHDLVPYAPSIVTTRRKDEVPQGHDTRFAIIEIGTNGRHDPSGRLARLMRGSDTILVRPDGHVAWAGSFEAWRDGLAAGLGYAGEVRTREEQSAHPRPR